MTAAFFSGEVHPYAATFPMLPDEDLKALAEDIAANGLLHPILLDPDGWLIDGRNRLAACDLAGVEPEFKVYAGDPVRLIVSANMQRRDLTQGQKAHLLVAGLSNLDKGQEALAAVAGIPQGRIAEAVVVRRYAPMGTSEAVIAGRMTHARAYELAKSAKDELAQAEQQERTLTIEAPDIFATDLPLDEKWAAYLKRTKEQREAEAARADAIRQDNRAVTEAVFRLHLLNLNPGNVTDWLDHYTPADAIHPTTRAELDHAITALKNLRKGLQ